MKEFFRKSLLFIIFFIVFFALVNFLYITIIISTDWDFQKRIESLSFKNPDFDLLVLGSSMALDGIDAGLLTSNGISSYNMALGGNSMMANYIQLKEYLTKYSKKPKYVLLGINSSIESFTNDKIPPVIEVTAENYKYTINDIPILRFKWLGFEFLKKIVSSKHRKAKLYNGQLKFEKTGIDNTKFGDSLLNIQKFESSPIIGDIAKLCSQNGIELLILELPGFKETQNLHKIGPYKLTFLNGLNADLYNFNSMEFCSIFDSSNDWVAKSHLNKCGAAKFTRELMSILKK